MVSGENRTYILPTLLERLRGGGGKRGGAGFRALSPAEQRASVLGDLEALFNTGNLASVRELDRYPHVARSVLNYGVPCFAGKSLSNMGEDEFERLFRQAIIDYEPRIIPRSVEVRVEIEEEIMNRTAVTLHISGRLLTDLDLALRTEVDMETGNVAISDETRRTIKDKDSRDES